VSGESTRKCSESPTICLSSSSRSVVIHRFIVSATISFALLSDAAISCWSTGWPLTNKARATALSAAARLSSAVTGTGLTRHASSIKKSGGSVRQPCASAHHSQTVPSSTTTANTRRTPRRCIRNAFSQTFRTFSPDTTRKAISSRWRVPVSGSGSSLNTQVSLAKSESWSYRVSRWVAARYPCTTLAQRT